MMCNEPLFRFIDILFLKTFMKLKKLQLSAVFLFCLSINSFAQSNPPPPGNPDPFVDVPINEAISLLIATSIVFGSFIVRSKKSKS